MKKHIVMRGSLLLLITGIFIWAICHLSWYHETKNCLCSVLTEENKTYPIDDRLFSIAERDMLISGTFTRLTTSCPHGARIQLTIYPDEGIYSGYRLDTSEW